MGKCKFIDLLLCYTNKRAFFTLPGLSKNSKQKKKKENKTNPFHSSTLDSKAEGNTIREVATRFRDE